MAYDRSESNRLSYEPNFHFLPPDMDLGWAAMWTQKFSSSSPPAAGYLSYDPRLNGCCSWRHDNQCNRTPDMDLGRNMDWTQLSHRTALRGNRWCSLTTTQNNRWFFRWVSRADRPGSGMAATGHSKARTIAPRRERPLGGTYRCSPKGNRGDYHGKARPRRPGLGPARTGYRRLHRSLPLL